ncbi:MAG: 30S ribosomal protein S8 [Candidatus Paceibacterota bacterium]|jgi:small subunit ribosomal protein S8
MYIDLLTQIKNAQGVRSERIKYPASKMDEKVLEILAKNNFIKEFEKKGRGNRKYFEIVLSYKGKDGGIEGIKFVSTPSKKVYRKSDEIRQIRQGFGMSLVSTSKGIMTNREARKNKLGGQILFNIW